MRKPEDTTFGYFTTKTPAMYDQTYVDGLKNEIEHYKKLYRDLLVQKRDSEYIWVVPDEQIHGVFVCSKCKEKRCS